MYIVLYRGIPNIYKYVENHQNQNRHLMVIVVKTQIEKMYDLPNTPYNYKISSNISLLFYKCHCLDLRFQTTPFRGWCRRSQILLYLELYNLEILQPKLHYLHFQFLRICKKHDTRIFPKNVLWGSVNFHLLPVARPPQQHRLSLRTMRGAPPAAGQQPILVVCERCAATSGGRRAA